MRACRTAGPPGPRRACGIERRRTWRELLADLWAPRVPAGNVTAMPTPPSGGPSGLSRRDLLKSLGFAAAAARRRAPGALGHHRQRSEIPSPLAAATAAAGSDLGAVEHIVFLMMENRSYDHYFGDYPKGRGFNDHPAARSACSPRTIPGGTSLVPPDVLLPFHLDSTAGLECTDDLTHDWGPQHLCWNDGQDGRVRHDPHLVDATRAPTAR